MEFNERTGIDVFKMALSNFRKIDITTQEGKRKIIDTFINAIYLYDDHLKIIYMPTAKKKQSALQNSKVQPCFLAGHQKDEVAKAASSFCMLFFAVYFNNYSLLLQR